MGGLRRVAVFMMFVAMGTAALWAKQYWGSTTTSQTLTVFSATAALSGFIVASLSPSGSPERSPERSLALFVFSIAALSMMAVAVSMYQFVGNAGLVGAAGVTVGYAVVAVFASILGYRRLIRLESENNQLVELQMAVKNHLVTIQHDRAPWFVDEESE